tara:strand:- start:214 stop:822 length:609 start_codon:yes stop_codon:yes gene_type:complete
VEYTKKSLIHNNRIVMHEWEDDMMKKHAEIVCENGGDILEVGFGMGISADYIQKQDIKSHTIIENDEVVYEKLIEWAKDKPNVEIIFGDWQNSLPDKKFDGIFFDTWGESKISFLFPLMILKCCDIGTIVSFFNQITEPETKFKNIFKSSKLDFFKVEVDIPNYVDYLSSNESKYYYAPRWIVSQSDTKENFMKYMSSEDNK